MPSPSVSSLQELCAENFHRLASNPYPGRGIVLGRAENGLLLQVYWIMGRSANSRNRIFVSEGGRLRTEPLDPSTMEHPELVIYTAMDSHEGQHVVTNGDQTDSVIAALRAGADYRAALRQRAHEPDAPNHTPRIAGGIREREQDGWMALIKAEPECPRRSIRAYYEFEAFPPGLGWCLTTYRGDGNPLPPFSGEPYPLPLAGHPEALLSRYWECLNGENRIALALKTIDPESGEVSLRIRNAHPPST